MQNKTFSFLDIFNRLKVVSEYKYLGLHLDSNLAFKNQGSVIK